MVHRIRPLRGSLPYTRAQARSAAIDRDQKSLGWKAAPHPSIVGLELAVVRERSPVGVQPVDDRNPVARRERAPGACDDVSGLEIPAPQRCHAGNCRPEAPKITAVLHNPVPFTANEALR